MKYCVVYCALKPKETERMFTIVVRGAVTHIWYFLLSPRDQSELNQIIPELKEEVSRPAPVFDCFEVWKNDRQLVMTHAQIHH